MMTAEEIRSQVASGALSADSALPLVEQALRFSPCVGLWILRGDLIQLADSAPFDVEEAARSYREAHMIAPDDPEPLEELGHFYHAVMPDRVAAERYYRAALAKGAGDRCRQALADLLENS